MHLPAGAPDSLTLHAHFLGLPIPHEHSDGSTKPGPLQLQVLEPNDSPQQVATTQCKDNSPPLLSQQPGHWDIPSKRWMGTSGCEYRAFSQQEASQCLDGKNIMFFGDSHVRALYEELNSLLAGGQANHEKYHTDKTAQIGSIAITFWFANSAFLSAPHHKPTSPDTKIHHIFGGYYLADMGSFFMGVKEYSHSATTSTEKLRQMHKAQVTWHLPHAVHPEKTQEPFDMINSWGIQREIRKQLLLDFALHAPNVDLFDPLAMTQCRSDATEDGNHYTPESNVNRMKLDMWLTSIC